MFFIWKNLKQKTPFFSSDKGQSKLIIFLNINVGCVFTAREKIPENGFLHNPEFLISFKISGVQFKEEKPKF